jgi:hypothetical protein
MVWKIFSVLSAALLAGSVYFGYSSRKDLKEETGVRDRSARDYAAAKNRAMEADTKLKAKAESLVTHEGELTKKTEEVKTADATATAKEQERDLAKTNEEQYTKQLAEVQKEIDAAGDIEKLLAQVNALKNDQSTAETDLSNQTQALAGIQEKLTSTTKETDRLRTVEADARRGVMQDDFTARIAQSFGDWGFAVLNKGNSGGVIANADLEVKRGATVVAKLKVRNVEQNISVADIVQESIVDGALPQNGDLVVVAPKKADDKPAAAITPAAAVTAPAPAPAPAVTPAAADPFATPAAPAGAMDPFGSPAPAAPAAGAPAAADPFGTPAPAAPAAGGAGTKESPSTADPFAK